MTEIKTECEKEEILSHIIIKMHKYKILRIPLLSIILGVLLSRIEFVVIMFIFSDLSRIPIEYSVHVLMGIINRWMIFLGIAMFVASAKYCMRDMTKIEVLKSAAIVSAANAILFFANNLNLSRENPELMLSIYIEVFYRLYLTVPILLRDLFFLDYGIIIADIDTYVQYSFLLWISLFASPFLYVFWGKDEYSIVPEAILY